jgi:hypothetical protein
LFVSVLFLTLSVVVYDVSFRPPDIPHHPISAPPYVSPAGSDIPVVALMDDAAAMNGMRSIGEGQSPCGFIQTMACDNDAATRRFIDIAGGGSAGKLIFHHIEQVCKSDYAQEGIHANGWGPFREVPQGNDLMISSFVCKQVSFENQDRQAHANTIDNRVSATSVTFHGSIDFFVANGCKVGISENVVALVRGNSGKPMLAHEDKSCCGSLAKAILDERDGDVDDDSFMSDDSGADTLDGESGTDEASGSRELDRTNMVAIEQKFEENSIEMTYSVLYNHRFLFPHHRGRLWLIYASSRRLGITASETQERLQKAKRITLSLMDKCATTMVDIDECLLPEDDELLTWERMRLELKWETLQTAAELRLVQPAKKARSCQKEKRSWVPEMRAVYESEGVEFIAPPLDAGMGAHVGRCPVDAEGDSVWRLCLPTREKYILALIQAKYPKQHSGERRVIVTSRSAKRCLHEKPRVKMTSCLLPHHRYFLEWRDRWMTGNEKLAFQGLMTHQFNPKAAIMVFKCSWKARFPECKKVAK